MHAQGLRVVLVAAALVALLHGLLLKALDADGLAPYRDRPGRAHDGRPHESLGRMYARSRDDDLREMFEFASQPPFSHDLPAQRRDCGVPPDIDADFSRDLAPCASGPEAAGYMPARIVNRYVNEPLMNGGIDDAGIAAFDTSIGLGGATL